MKTLQLYSRPGCHLCDELAVELAPLLAGRAVVERIDISKDAALEERYGLRIPVVADGSVELSGYPLARAEIERYLSN